jgi:hypothetical protein
MNKNLKINVDYYLNSNGDFVFTKEYHLKRGHCCESNCLHCPYREKIDPSIPQEFTNNWSEEILDSDQNHEDDY